MNATENTALLVLKAKGMEPNAENIKTVLDVLQRSYNEVYKAVAFDVDGTLTKKNSTEIDENMSEIIGELLKKGVHVLLISGRGRGSLREAVKQIIENTQLSPGYIRRLSCIAHGGVFWLRSTSLNIAELLITEEVLVSKQLKLLVKLKNEIITLSEFNEYFINGSIKITDEPTINPYLLRINYNAKLYKSNNELFNTFYDKIINIIEEVYKEESENVFLTQATYADNVLLNISNTSKTVALNFYAEKIGIHPNSILRVGDQGHNTGNDYELLNTESGFSVGTISREIDKCLPVINDEGDQQLFGVDATRTLLKRIHLFPPLSLEPHHQPEQLRSLHRFEELAVKRSKNEIKMLTEKLRLRLHRLFDSKDVLFDHHSFQLPDLFDLHSGGIILKSYEVTKIDENNSLRNIFNLNDAIFYQSTEPKLTWAVFTDTNILLRGANYYWAMTHKELMLENPNNYFSIYFDACVSFIFNAKKCIDNLIFESPNFIAYKFILGISDNIRNILLNYLYAMYKIDTLNNDEWKFTKNIYGLLRTHTAMLYDILFDEDLSWKALLLGYSEILKKLPSPLKKATIRINSRRTSFEKGLLRKWREADFFFENVIAINLGIHEFSEQIHVAKNKKNINHVPVIGLGLAYGGSELPLIAEIVAQRKGINLKGALLEISLYGNSKVRENILSDNPLKDIELYKGALSNYVEFSDDKTHFENKRVILLDDNCTTCRTLETTRNILIKEGAEIIGAVVVRFPATNRYTQMLLPRHGLPDSDILLSFIRGFVSPSPYTRIFGRQEEKGKEYHDKSGIFDKSRNRIIRYLRKNGNSIND